MASPIEMALKIEAIASSVVDSMTRIFERERWPNDMRAIVYRAVARRADKLAAAAETNE